MISKSMWHYDGVKEGHLDLSGEPVKALLASYVAFIAKKVDALETIGDSIEHEANDESLASLLSRGHVPSEVSNFLLFSFDEYWQSVSRDLAREFDSDALRDFVLSDDFFTFETGRNSGEFATPECLRELALKILGICDGDNVADLCCGGGGFLADVAMSASETGLFGIDLSPQDVALSVARLDLLGADYDIRCGDMLAEPAAKRFEKVFSNYPFGFRVASMRGKGNFYGSLRSGKHGRVAKQPSFPCRRAYLPFAPGGTSLA
jgi:type I restriction-modification system DNA methylase subunit